VGEAEGEADVEAVGEEAEGVEDGPAHPAIRATMANTEISPDKNFTFSLIPLRYLL
jgi:hypothetical protein